MNFKRWFNLVETQILSEDFKSQRQKFIQQGVEPAIVDRYLAWFREIKDKKYKEITAALPGVTVVPAQRINIDAYPTFHELEVVVDYVNGQRGQRNVAPPTTKGNNFTDIETTGKPIYNSNGIEIYYAETPRACIQYKGNVPYGWCIARKDASNMFYTYRYKEHRPSFYFVKDLEKTKAEFGLWNATKTVFSGAWRDKYHFFVVQVLKNANLNDQHTQQYIVTSAQNDGDRQMNWSDLLRIEPKLQGLQNVFAPTPLTPDEEKEYERFKNGVDDATFEKLNYNDKDRYLDIAVRTDKPLSDAQFESLPNDLKNKYVGFGVGLSNNQYGMIEHDRPMVKRYKDITIKKVEELLKSNQSIPLKPTEIDIIIDAGSFMPTIDKLLETSKYDSRPLQNILGNIDYKAFSKLNPEDQNKIIGIIVRHNMPVTDVTLLEKIVAANKADDVAREYLDLDMIEKIIELSADDNIKFDIAKKIIDMKAEDVGGTAKFLEPQIVRALLMSQYDSTKHYVYLNNIGAYLVQNELASEREMEHILELTNSEKLANLILAKYGKDMPHDLLIAILNNVRNKEAAKIALQMKDKLSEDELQSILRYTNMDQEELYGILGHHAHLVSYPDGHSWVSGDQRERQGSEIYYLIGPDGKIKVRLSAVHQGIIVNPGGKGIQELMQDEFNKADKLGGKKDWDKLQQNVMQQYQEPSKWNDYIVDFIVKKPDIVDSISLRGGAWSIGELTPQQRETLFKGRPDLLPSVNTKTSNGEVWVNGTSFGKDKTTHSETGFGISPREFTLLDNYNPVLVLTLKSKGNYLDRGSWTADTMFERQKLDKPKYSLPTAEFILHNHIEHMDTREENKSDYGGWKFDDILPEHQQMILGVFPDFLEASSFVKKISKDKKEMLSNMGGYSLDLLDDNTVVVDRHSTIEQRDLLDNRGHIHLPDSDKWKKIIYDKLKEKIHGRYGENHSFDFEKLAKQGIEPLQSQFPFADEEMMNLAKDGGYKTSTAIAHSLGKVVVSKVAALLYDQLKPFESEQFKVKFDAKENKIYFVTSFDNVEQHYARDKNLKKLEEEFKAWKSNIKINWEEFINQIDKIERMPDKEAFRNAITGVTPHPHDYRMD
jgi:hypothetical protein